MNKEEAVQSMKEGKKVTHHYFSPEEWMMMKDNRILLEDGVVCTYEEFWMWRQEKEWDDGYSIWNESN